MKAREMLFCWKCKSCSFLSSHRIYRKILYLMRVACPIAAMKIDPQANTTSQRKAIIRI